uniref:Secreted protein n=1 Tax=Steinernema glaseri TaxID=37863 RepID=A0A1I7YX81_9BILA
MIGRGLAFVALIVFCSAQLDKFRWPRWEERTIDCTSSGRRDACTLIARNAKVERDPVKYKCRREPMPKTDWNKLAKSPTRLACPIGCEPDADLSVIQKKPANNTLCQKYYTYGKYRDHNEGEWYLWLTEPCVANLTTHCRFKDIPLYNSGSAPESAS